MFDSQQSYPALNLAAAATTPGAEGLLSIPFGNGAERMLNNEIVGAHLHGLDLNIHSTGHLVRSAQEGIAFAFRYGLDIMRENGLEPSVIRAGKANMFLSDVFCRAFVDATGVAVELYHCDGSVGAAVGAGIGRGAINQTEVSAGGKAIQVIEPSKQSRYPEMFEQWKDVLDTLLQKEGATQSLLPSLEKY